MEVKSVFGFRVRLENPDLDFENLNPDFPIERTLSSFGTPYGPNQRIFNVLLDLFVYFSRVPFCFWWQHLFFYFLVIQISCTLETSLRFSIALFITIHKLSHTTPN